MGVELIRTPKRLIVFAAVLAVVAVLLMSALIWVNSANGRSADRYDSGQTPASAEPSPELPCVTEEPDMAMYKALTSEYEFTALDGETLYTYTGYGNLYCYEKPYEDSNIVCVLTSGTQVNVDGKTGKYYLLHLGYCSYAYADAECFIEGAAYAEAEGTVNLKKLLPDAVFTLDLASESNITGERLILPVPLMEEKSAAALEKAYQIFRSDGYTMQIYDAYRPVSAQYALYSAVADESYVRNPDRQYSEHNKGKAVDFTLIDSATGLKIRTPTDVHCFMEDALICNYEIWEPEIRRNVDYMAMVMSAVGFRQADTAWWHFEYTGEDSGSMNTNFNFSALRYEITETAQEK